MGNLQDSALIESAYDNHLIFDTYFNKTYCILL